MFHADRQDKANSCFCNFTHVPKKWIIYRFFWCPVSLGTRFSVWRQSSGPIFKSWPLSMRPLCCLETLETNHPVTQGHFPEEQIPHSYQCEKPKTHILKTWCKCWVNEIYINRKYTEITSLNRKCKQPSTQRWRPLKKGRYNKFFPELPVCRIFKCHLFLKARITNFANYHYNRCT